MKDNIRNIQLVINSLNEVSVSGKFNLDRLLASILTLEKVIKELKEEETGNG